MEEDIAMDMDVFCNPINIPYRYQIHKRQDGTVYACREAADPSLILYHGKYYMFISMSCGALVSDDLVDWKMFPLPEELPNYDYAPDVRVVDDWVYLIASREGAPAAQYRTRDPLHGPYERIGDSVRGMDPNRFQDQDGRVYFYCGCSDETPLYGVELDRNTMVPLTERKPLFMTDTKRRGYERSDLLDKRKPFLEGAWMTEHGGKYYLQYAVPGTQFETYADGVAESRSPLGPFVPARNNPFSYAPGSFCPGAGHGSTLEDKEGQWWHVATMRISVRHMFERRIGLFPSGFDQDGELYCNQRFPDWPQHMSKLRKNPFSDPEWMILSVGAACFASSEKVGHEARNAAVEDIRTDWQAVTATDKEYLCMDLGEVCLVHAVQINFSEGNPDVSHLQSRVTRDRWIDTDVKFTRWLLEGSTDGLNYSTIADKRQAETDLPHDLIVIGKGLSCRYLRLTHIELPYGQNPCVSALRVFGKGTCRKPKEAKFEASRISSLNMEIRIQSAKDAVGWVIQFGHEEEKLYHSFMTYEPGNHVIGALVEGEDCYVRVDAFNRKGITYGSVIKL